MKKIVPFSLLLNCSMMMYAMDEHSLIPLQEGYKIISVQQGTRPVVPVVDSKPRRDFYLVDNVVLGSVGGNPNNDGTWQYKLCLGLQRDIIHDLELDSHPRLPAEKELTCSFSTEKKMWGNIFENLDKNQPVYILLEGKNKETQKEEYVVLNITRQLFSVFTIEIEDEETQNVSRPANPPAPHFPNHTPIGKLSSNFFHKQENSDKDIRELLFNPWKPYTNINNCIKLDRIQEGYSALSQIKVYLGNVELVECIEEKNLWKYRLEFYDAEDSQNNSPISYFISSEKQLNIATDFHKISVFSILTKEKIIIKEKEESLVFKVMGIQIPKETPNLSGHTEFDPLPENFPKDSKPTKQYSWSFIAGTGAAFTVAAILVFYQLHCLPDAFMHFIDNLRSGFRGQS